MHSFEIPRLHNAVRVGALQMCHGIACAVGLHLRIFVYPSFNFYDEDCYEQVAGCEILTGLHSCAELSWSHWCY